jgi:hypothetical protein
MEGGRACRAMAPSAGLILGLAAIAWAMRWNPQLNYALEKTSFYLETPVQRQDGTFEAPVINCAVTGRVTNAGRSALWAEEVLPAEWSPAMEEDPGQLSATATFTLVQPRGSLKRLGFRHVPADSNRVRFRFRTFLIRPNPWKDWLASRLPSPGSPPWLVQFANDRQTLLTHSDWFEAEVPDLKALRATPD